MELAGDLAYDPLGFAKGFWPDDKAPRKWQADILGHLSERLADTSTRHQVQQVAVASGHGIGKSAFMGMMVTWAMSCHAFAKVMVTAGTGQQLATKTVPEITKWVKGSLGAHWFDCHATSIRSLQTANPENWRTDFVTWSVHNTDPFAGLHNKDRIVLVIFDEASAIDDAVWEVTQGALTDEHTVLIWLAFGNPTRNTGRFRECFGRFQHRWKTFHIDSRTVEGTNKAELDRWVEDYGEDSDFVRVRIRGEFPRAGSNQFIPGDTVAIARKFKAAGYEQLPKILGVDVARFGDDQTVIGLRQGRKFAILAKYRGKDLVQTAAEVIRFIEQEAPEATVIDADGIGAGVVDQIRHRGYSKGLFEFHGGQPARNGNAYFNRRAEIWGEMRDWLLATAEIPDDPDLESDLTGIEYGFSSKQQIQLEKKEEMKKRGLASPDLADALAMTFAEKILAKPKPVPQIVQRYVGQANDSWMG